MGRRPVATSWPWLLAFSVFAVSASVNAQQRPQLRAVRVEEPPVLDGFVRDDPAWLGAQVATGFIQVEPDAGRPATERTEVRVVFSESTLYVGVVCFDSQPGAIVVGDARRDASLDDTDSFQVVLDTFNDKTNGFVFGTNPAGIEYDGQVVNQGEGGGRGGGFNRDWNGSWQVATRIAEHGWSAEMAIPFKTLRYAGGGEQVWGINFQRQIGRRNERAYWAPIDVQFNLFRVSLAGILYGVETPRQRVLQLTPYVLGEVGREGFEDAPVEDDYEVGLDVLKYGVTSSLMLDVTVNTDFAQVEADEQQVNLSRFNLFFPEKRPFFLENAGLFSVGEPGEIELFFSRQIGLAEGEVIPIYGGVRLSGKVGRTNIGVLDMQTEEHVTQPDDDGALELIPSNNFGVIRVSHELANRTRVGGIFTNRQGSGRYSFGEDYSRTWGVDGQVGIGSFYDLEGFVAQTDTPGLTGRDHALGLDTRYSSPTWRWGLGYQEVGEDFNPEVGFLRREGFRRPEGYVSYRWRPTSLVNLREVRPRVFYRGYWDFDGFQESGLLWTAGDFVWRNGASVDLGIAQSLEGLKEDFEIYEGIFVPPGTYEETEVVLRAGSNPARTLSGGLEARVGGFYGGDKLTLEPELELRIGDFLTSELAWQYNDVDLPWGAFETNLGKLRVTYSFTTHLLLQALIQYNDVSDDVSTNLRFSWLKRANTGLFVVYNELREFGAEALPKPERSLIVKYTKFIDVFR